MNTLTKFILFYLLIIVSCSPDQSNSENKQKETILFESSWESLKKHETPEWLLDAKFGIYAHWGLYSVPAYGNEWYGRMMYDVGSDIHRHHVETYGDPSEFGNKEFVPLFKAENFNPDEWADIIEASGAKYAGFALVHHDGYCLWDSEYTRWNSMDTGPGRDLYGELVQSLRKKEDMKVIATFHHIRTFNWYLPYKVKFYEPIDDEIRQTYIAKNWDIFDPAYADLYWNQETGMEEDFIKEWNNKVTEVIEKYQPDVIWFDGGQFQDSINELMVMDLLAHYYNKGAKWNKEVEILNKLPTSMKFNFPAAVGMKTFEEGRDRKNNLEGTWIDDMKISHSSWGYVEGQTYKDPDVIIDGLIDRVSRGGGLVLSLCPKADGTINPEQKNVLTEIGGWLKINGEAIYGTRKWKIQAEGDEEKLIKKGKHSTWVFDQCDANDIRFTKKGNELYALVLGAPDTEKLNIQSLGTTTRISTRGIKNISLLGSDEKIKWERNESGLVLHIPSQIPSEYALAFKIELKGDLLQ
jgi:alpha-L-fucosidase